MAEESFEDRPVIFHRLHSRGDDEVTGVGIAVRRNLVERHGGTLVAMSEVGEGSTFHVTMTGAIDVPAAALGDGTKAKEQDMSQTAIRPAEVLLVEDKPADVRLAREALEEARVLNHLHVVGDGDQAILFLKREPPFGNAPRPDLVLLDLDLPKNSGRNVLAEIKGSACLHSIPVVVLAASQAEEDIFRTYQLRANGFISKPMDLEKLAVVLQQIETSC